MTYIANPIYDSVFKYLMEDDKVAKILLSALLQKEVVDLQMRRHEYTNMQQTSISLFRIDFSARVRNSDGSENLILIELQKTWLITETLRFRQYLGAQYINKENVLEEEAAVNTKKGYGLPIVAIYILGHKVGDIKEPVIYVKRQYLDYNSNFIDKGVPDKFIESLTHDSVIVQLPYLQGKMRNRLERLLNLFDQQYIVKGNEHLLEINEDNMDEEGQIVVKRLSQAALAPEIRRNMQVEDEILTEIEGRDTTIMIKNKEIQEKETELKRQKTKIQKNKATIQKNEATIQKNEATIRAKEKAIIEQNQQLKVSISLLADRGMKISDIAKSLFISEEDIIKILG